MSEVKSETQKNILFGFLMFFGVLVIATITYFTVSFIIKPEMLTAPNNLSLQNSSETFLLTWDEVEDADWYTIHLLNRTDGTVWNIHIYPINYTIDEFNKVEYDITRNIELESNYSITVKANSNNTKLKSSGYCEAYELEQVNTNNDVEPLIT